MNAFAQIVADIRKKPDEHALSVQVTFRASGIQRDFINENGGPEFLRKLVSEAMRKQEQE